MITSFLNTRIENSIAILKSCSSINREVNSLHINGTYFNKLYFDNDIRESAQLKDVFDQLKQIKNPVLYWFEIDETKINANAVRQLYTEYLVKKTNRAISSYKKDFDINSRTLYVGKVKTGFWGRLITHLGYHKSSQTAGLQLYHWYKVQEGMPPLKLNYMVFEREMEDLISILELDLARELKPILGRY
ncbi:MAG: hypothetical protein JST78_09320 [Bacteroidetes bacterium]|nr:hypothetical protein [Bacteroidota bacterium]